MSKFNQKDYTNEYDKLHYKQFKVKLKNEEKEELDKLLDQENITKAQFLRDAIDDFKTNLNPNKKTQFRIAKKYWNNEDLKNELKIIGYVYSEIDYANYAICNISEFRKFVHTIIDYEFPDVNNEELHKKISNNDFTVPILLGIVEVTHHDVLGVMNK